METITINVPNGKKAKQTELNGKITIEWIDLPKKITERVKSFEDACKEAGFDPDLDFNFENDTPDEIAYKKLKLIVSVLNEGWKPNWNDGSEKKWWPWFSLSSGFSFDGSIYGYATTATYVGSRLCFKSEELSTHCAKQFIDLYETLLTFKS